MLQFLGILLSSACIWALPDSPDVTPVYLDMLRSRGEYEEFAKLVGVDDVRLIMPNEDDSTDPMMNAELFLGDILLNAEQAEQARQGINFQKYGGSKWPNNQVPYYISWADFGFAERGIIEDAIQNYNSRNTSVTIVPWFFDSDYVMVISGNGCYSNLGKIGGRQTISLQRNGCLVTGIVQHEFTHAIGFTHEQNRSDRDEYIELLPENIPPEWLSQYEKVSEEDFINLGPYDYYSVMHYPVAAPGTGKPAFRVLKENVDESKIGQRDGLTAIDVQKTRKLYTQ